jgi:multidrug resistance efflux pump
MKSELVQGQLDNESLEQVLHTLRKQVDSLQEENTNAKTQIRTLEQKILDAQIRWNEHELDFKTIESTLSNKIQLLEQSNYSRTRTTTQVTIKKDETTIRASRVGEKRNCTKTRGRTNQSQ